MTTPSWPEWGMLRGTTGPIAGPLLAATAALTLAACAPGSGAIGAAGRGGGDPEDLVLPAGHGTLRQDEITMSLRSGPLQVKVTPLEEWILRLTAPDTHRRLSELAASHRPAVARETGEAEPALFLVSFFSEQPSAPYDPEDLTLSLRGRRHRPLSIRPVSAGWGTQRLDQRETRTAVYAFPPAVDMEMGLVVEYGDARNHQWDAILQSLQTEHARVRARAGAGYPSSSRPNRLILR